VAASLSAGGDPPSLRSTEGLGRRAVVAATLLLAPSLRAAAAPPSADFLPDQRWYEAAESMKQLAEGRGDEPYGAVVVANGQLVGNGPSRVVARNDPSAHAEREAIRDAQLHLGRRSLAGAVLYSTSRPCRQCESAAAEAQIARLIYGPDLRDAGKPRS
jgi:tRNA(adenine34) deaminase